MFLRIIIFLSLPFIFCSCFPLSIDSYVKVDENEDWLFIGGDPGKTNISKSKSLLEPPYNLYWEFNADGGLAKNCLSVSDGLLFANTLNGESYSIDIFSGKSLGRTSTLGGSSFSTPLIFRNNIIITSSGNDNSRIFSYNLIHGEIKWKKNIGWVESSPVYINQNIIVSSLNGLIFDLDILTGNIVWTAKPGDKKYHAGSFHTSPTISGNKVFAGNDDGYLYAFDLKNGSDLFKFKTGASIFCDASAKDGKIYFGSDDYNFYCIDTSGNLIWKKNLNTKFLASSTFYKGMVITSAVDGNVYAMDTLNGDIKWTFKTKGAIWASPLLQNNNIYIGSFDKNFYCLNAEDGNKLWSYPCDGRIKTSAVIWKNYIFTASDDKYIYCFSDKEFPKSSSVSSSK